MLHRLPRFLEAFEWGPPTSAGSALLSPAPSQVSHGAGPGEVRLGASQGRAVPHSGCDSVARTDASSSLDLSFCFYHLWLAAELLFHPPFREGDRSAFSVEHIYSMALLPKAKGQRLETRKHVRGGFGWRLSNPLPLPLLVVLSSLSFVALI